MVKTLKFVDKNLYLCEVEKLKTNGINFFSTELNSKFYIVYET